MQEQDEEDKEPKNFFQFLEDKKQAKEIENSNLISNKLKNIQFNNYPGIHIFEIKNNSNFELCVHTHESFYELILKHQDFRRYMSPNLIKLDRNTWNMKFNSEDEPEIELEIRYLSTIENKQLKALRESDIEEILIKIKQEFETKRTEEMTELINNKIEMQKQHIENLISKSQSFWKTDLETQEEYLDGPI